MIGTELKCRIRKRVLDSLDYSESISDEELRSAIFNAVNIEASETFLPLEMRVELQNVIFDSIRGFDVLGPLLEDEGITEIMINGANSIFVEERGKLYKTELQFESQDKFIDVIQQIVSGVNRTVNESEPIVDARLPDGSRVNIVLPPVAINGPIVTIRKFSRKPFDMNKLVEMGALSKAAADFLTCMVRAKYNIFISGGTGSGKTTFLNALAFSIPDDERVITIEDSAELMITNIDNLVRLEVREKNMGECREITIRDLIRSSLRMRPDRIIVGEVRGEEVCDMLSAMSTGHDGSLSTGHGNSVSDMLDRLETMMMMGVDIPLKAVRKRIGSAIDIMVHLGRLRDGSRKVLEISEVLGVSDGEIALNPLFVFRENDRKENDEENNTVTGELIRSGNGLVCRGKLRRAGIELPDD